MKVLLLEFKAKAMVDPYGLKGQEKIDQINYLFEIQDNFESLQCPTDRDRERYYLSCLWLEAEAKRRQRQYAESAEYQRRKKIKMVDEAVDRFKTIMKLEFMQKYQAEISQGKITPEMSAAMDRMNRIEKAACYRISGINVSLQDCNTCEHKSCRR